MFNRLKEIKKNIKKLLRNIVKMIFQKFILNLKGEK